MHALKAVCSCHRRFTFPASRREDLVVAFGRHKATECTAPDAPLVRSSLTPRDLAHLGL
ncbi:MAG TPA: hypothetical protein VM286_00445 [Candidatus Thermoplasmatota archaeon]|nr:hypothetical protein [Candidatus Thermoplasmatota archaeon]